MATIMLINAEGKKSRYDHRLRLQANQFLMPDDYEEAFSVTTRFQPANRELYSNLNLAPVCKLIDRCFFSTNHSKAILPLSPLILVFTNIHHHVNFNRSRR